MPMPSPTKMSAMALGIIIVLITAVYLYRNRDGMLASPDGVVARRSQLQSRTDPQFDSWDVDKLENCVNSINARA